MIHLSLKPFRTPVENLFETIVTFIVLVVATLAVSDRPGVVVLSISSQVSKAVRDPLAYVASMCGLGGCHYAPGDSDCTVSGHAILAAWLV